MLRGAARCLLPTVRQVTEKSGVVGRRHCTRCIRRPEEVWNYQDGVVPQNHRLLLPPAATSSGTWQQRKHLRSLSYRHYHVPFSIARMTSDSLLHTPQTSSSSTSGITSPIPLWAFPDTALKECHVRLYSTKPPSVPSTPVDENHNEAKTLTSSGESGGKSNAEKGGTTTIDNKKEEKVSIVQKFKLMYKQYWYVLIPVHCITSVFWYGSFFIAAKSGVDIVPIMEKLGAGEKILSHLQNSNAGYYAIAYAMYKIATPARYTVTIGGTTLSINYLKKRGYIKPVPSSEQLKEMYEGKKEELIERKEEMVEKYQEKKDEMVEKYQERKDEMVEKYQERKEEMVEKYQERKDELVGKYQEKKTEMAQKVTDTREGLKERVAEKKEEIRDRIEESKEKLENIKGSIRKRR